MARDGFIFRSKRRRVVSSAKMGFNDGYLAERCWLLAGGEDGTAFPVGGYHTWG